MAPRMLPVMRMLRKTQPRITVKSLYFGGLFDSALNGVSIGLAPVNPRRDNAGPFELQHAAVLLFCALPNMEIKKWGGQSVQALAAVATSSQMAISLTFPP